jgi:hypothetical protein
MQKTAKYLTRIFQKAAIMKSADDSGVWFHTPRLAAAQITQRLQKVVLNQTVL